MSEYTFPFNTCEKPNKNGIAQPYSALVNLINCIIISYFLLNTKSTHTFILLLSILCFELFHVFSHTIHINGSIQINITHMLSYAMNLAFFYAFYCYTNIFPSNEFIFYLVVLVGLDVYSMLNLTIIYYLLSQSIIFISLLLYYYPLLPKFIQLSIYKIIFFIGVIILLFQNEKYNCEKMLKIYPNFPYHTFIEFVGIILFYIISSNFYKL
uniref:Uncharacterized protein n=1 Tax=viral metagenome TaxID=1070528 RepID=A0A6C0EBS7_9ZZZZ